MTATIFNDKASFTDYCGELEDYQLPQESIVENGHVLFNGEKYEVEEDNCFLEDGDLVTLYKLDDGEVYGIKAVQGIKRVIYVDDLNEIDYDNVGVHWTKSGNYNHAGGGSNGGTIKKSIKVTFFAAEFEVNEDATEISNREYPREEEVVLEMNQELEVVVEIESGWGVEREERVINVGTRADEWVKNL